MKTHALLLTTSLIAGSIAALATTLPANAAAPNTTAPAIDASLEAPRADQTFTVGTMRVQRYGSHGRALILIPGLEGGSWVWRSVIQRFRGAHVIYAVTLAGFDGLPIPAKKTGLLDQADASLLKLIDSRHIDKPVLIGHSLGGTLSIRFAEQHSALLSGVVAVDGMPVFGDPRVKGAEREAMATKIYTGIADATAQQYRDQVLAFMQNQGTIDPAKATRYAALNARSDQAAVAQYMREDVEGDYLPNLQDVQVPLLEATRYYAPDFSKPPMKLTQAQMTGFMQMEFARAPHAKVVVISPSRHFIMLDQPEQLNQAIAAFLTSL